MRVLITAGGTREPIDDVRVVANLSTGRLGCRLAESFAARGDEVVLLHGSGSAVPAVELQRHAFGPSSELWSLMQQQLPRADVVLHAAAVSDYVPVRAEGKLKSDEDELVLRMLRAPKLIDGLRDRAPHAFLVGFKLTSGRDQGAREDLARALLTRARLDLVVTNEAGAIGEQSHAALLVDGDGCRPVTGGKSGLAAAVVEVVARGRGRQLTPS